MSDLSLMSLLVIELRKIASFARVGFDDHGYAGARTAYEKLRATLTAEKLSELWVKARVAKKAGDQADVLYWLAVFGREQERRYAALYRKRPKVKVKRAKYMAGYQQRPDVKKHRAEYMKQYRAGEAEGASR